MAESIIHNGKIVPTSKRSLKIINRGLKYGDGLFETIRVCKGEIHLWNEHIVRLQKSMEILKMDTDSLDKTELLQATKDLLNENLIKSGGRVRITVYRDAEGLLTPSNNKVSYIIEALKLKENIYQLNGEGISIVIYTEIPKPINILSNLKTTNCLIYIMAAIYRESVGADDCLLLNEKGSICEAMSSNVFIVKNKVLYTPPLSSGCLDGVMRKKIISICQEIGIKLFEKELFKEDLSSADELLLTNAISGVRWVSEFGKTKYQNNFAHRLIDQLNKGIM